MIAGVFYGLAGIDVETLKRCPPTDKIWAVQLGASLLVSTVLVFLFALHSTSYVPALDANPPLQVSVASLVALTVFLFDRALYQSDWFRHGYFRLGNPVTGRDRMGVTEKCFRVGGRLLLSFVLATVLASFLELALFSGAILDRLQQNHRAVNAPHIAKMAHYRSEQESQIDIRRGEIARLQKKTATISGEAAIIPEDSRLQDIAQQQDRLVARERQLLADIRAKETEISDRKLEVICESQGTKPDRRNPERCSGLPSCGPRCRTAIGLVKVHEAEVLALQAQLDDVRNEAKISSASKDKVIADITRIRDGRRFELDQQRRDLAAEIERKEAGLREFETTMPARIRAYEDEIKRGPGYVEFRDDPLMRLRAFLELKSDEIYGPVVTRFALGLKLFIMFMEVVPVIAKMLLAPPSAYAIHIQKRVERHQKLDLDVDDTCDADDGPTWKSWRRVVAAGGADGQQAAEGGRHLTIVR